MLLFADGFENFDVTDLDKKWDFVDFPLLSVSDLNIENSGESKRGRWLHGLARNKTTPGSPVLVKKIKKSRTVFVGFAFRADSNPTMHQNPVAVIFKSNGRTVAVCHATLNSSSVTFRWDFLTELYLPDDYRYTSTINADSDSQYNVIEARKDPFDNMMYYEFGITLNGNATDIEDCTAWVENRLDKEPGKSTSIKTTPKWDAFFFDEVVVKLGGTGWVSSSSESCTIWLDDLYITNDEGSFNNNFLGAIRIKAMTPSYYGSINNTEMVNFEGSRHEGVAVDFVNTVDTLPDPLPDPEQNPDFIPWTDPTLQYLRLNSEDDTQLFRMTHPNYAGAEPHIIGVSGTVVCRAKTDIGKKAKLQLARRDGLAAVEISGKDTLHIPIKTEEWQGRTLVMENEEEILPGMATRQWDITDINEADWGFRLLENDTDPKDYLSGFSRYLQIHDEILFERILTQDFTHRFWDRLVDEIISYSSFSASAWAQFAYEGLTLEAVETVMKRGHKGINESLYIKDEIPWHYLFIKEILQLDDPMTFAWGGDVFEEFEIGDSSYHAWVEQLTSQIDLLSSEAKTNIGENIRELLNLTEPLVWDNHESILESIDMMVTYVWTNHELIQEWVTHEVATKMGFGKSVESSLDIIEEHFDGWWVEHIEEQQSFWFEPITQHWRHEWFIGVIINSIKMVPIEDTGQWGGDGEDGDRVGFIEWGETGYGG